jgi:hypothetical protein
MIFKLCEFKLFFISNEVKNAKYDKYDMFSKKKKKIILKDFFSLFLKRRFLSTKPKDRFCLKLLII